jgi:hypothetical protein
LNGYKVYDSSKIWDIIHKYSYEKVENFPKLDIYESAFHEWDNTPRYKEKAKIFLGTDLKIFKSNLSKLYKNAVNNNSEYIFYNAWNEWSESAYLEPDSIYGFKKLEIIKEIIEENSVKES